LLPCRHARRLANVNDSFAPLKQHNTDPQEDVFPIEKLFHCSSDYFKILFTPCTCFSWRPNVPHLAVNSFVGKVQSSPFGPRPVFSNVILDHAMNTSMASPCVSFKMRSQTVTGKERRHDHIGTLCHHLVNATADHVLIKSKGLSFKGVDMHSSYCGVTRAGGPAFFFFAAQTVVYARRKMHAASVATLFRAI
jgi:hypothetical protein